MDESVEEISKFGKINNPQLISKLIPYGLTNSNGDIQFPIIKNSKTVFITLSKSWLTPFLLNLKVIAAI